MAQGQAFIADSRPAEARTVGKRALDLAEKRGEPPQQAYALKLLGDTSLVEGAVSEGAGYFEQALVLATKCGMRPLIAQCSAVLALNPRRLAL